MERNDRISGILTSFFQEASVLVYVFGILDTYANNKLTRDVGTVVAALGTALLIAAFGVKPAFRFFSARDVRRLLILQEQAALGGKK